MINATGNEKGKEAMNNRIRERVFGKDDSIKIQNSDNIPLQSLY